MGSHPFPVRNPCLQHPTIAPVIAGFGHLLEPSLTSRNTSASVRCSEYNAGLMNPSVDLFCARRSSLMSATIPAKSGAEKDVPLDSVR